MDDGDREFVEIDLALDAVSELELDALMSELRANTPVFFWPRFNAWVVTRHEDVLRVLHDHETFSSANVYRSAGWAPETKALFAEAGVNPIGNEFMIVMDPPRHTEMRRQLNRVFTPGRVSQQEPEIRRIARECVEQFPRGEEFDFVELFAAPLQVVVLFRMMNLPEEDLSQLREWVLHLKRLVSFPLSPQEQLECARSAIELDAYVAELIESRRANPTDDFYSDLISDCADGRANWTDAELRAVISPGLILAAFTTTRNVMAFAMHNLLSRPELWASLVGDRSLLPAVIEESMRYSPPMFGFFRTTTRAVELGGVPIPEGATVLWSSFSGNRDETAFTCPGEFRVDRPPAPAHLSFGHGAHFCLGASLARLTLRVAFDVLLESVPTICLAPGVEPHFTLGPVARDFEELRLIVPVGSDATA